MLKGRKTAVLVGALAALMLLPVGIISASGQAPAAAKGGGGVGPVTLRFLTSATGKGLQAEQKVIDQFLKENPRAKVEVTSVAGTAEFITALKAKFAAGEQPDLYRFQGGNRVREFASAGLIYDMTDEPFMSQAKKEDLGFNSYKGRVYGFPINYENTGLFINREALKKYGDIKYPESFPQLLDACKAVRDKGLKYPMIIAGKDINNVSQFDFQYLATVVLANNPGYYKEMLEGKRHFNDPFIREMFAKFAKLREYMSPDALGVDNDEAIKRFIRGEGVFWVAHGSTIVRIRELAGPDFDFVIIPTVLQDKPEDRWFNVGLTQAVSISKPVKSLEAVRAFMTNFVKKESGEIMVREGGIISTYKGVDIMPDKSLDPCLPWFNSPKKIGHADLVWVPGIKDVMKEVTQKWFLGEPLDNVLNEWESQHQRLLKANPKFIEDYGKE
jgi:raffinose/stachyose/melibiose transport system substrate-binding protein